jgi:membrane protein required for colicin V production
METIQESLHQSLHTMNWLDFGIIVLIGMSVLMGIIRGFVREAMSLVTWVTAIVIGFTYCEWVANNWLASITMIFLRYLVAFILLALFTLIMGGILSYVISKLINFTGFGVTDRIIGTVFGFARGAAIVAIVILFAGSSPIAKDKIWVESQLVPRLQPLSIWMKERVPEDLMKKLPTL